MHKDMTRCLALEQRLDITSPTKSSGGIPSFSTRWSRLQARLARQACGGVLQRPIRMLPSTQLTSFLTDLSYGLPPAPSYRLYKFQRHVYLEGRTRLGISLTPTPTIPGAAPFDPRSLISYASLLYDSQLLFKLRYLAKLAGVS